MNARPARISVLALVAVGAAVAVALALAGAAKAVVTINCAPYGAQTAADVQTAANGGGTVNIRGVCPGRVTLTTSVTLAGLTPSATSGLDATSAPGAPVITVDATPVTLSNLLVTGGVNGGDGGGVWDICGWSACGGGVLNITGSKVTGNKLTAVDSWGAGINAESDTTVNITNTYVTGNTTTAALSNGAGIASDDASAVNVTGSVVSGNTSQAAEGGGIYVRGTGSLSVTSSTISNNSADDVGGGIASAGANVHVLKSNILSNHAGSGGGIYATPSSSGFGLVSIASTTLDHNQASQTGGGVLADAGCGGGFLSIVVQTATFSSNSTTTPIAGGGGFAQSANCGSRVNTTMTDTLFNANVAPGAAGGALYSLTDDYPSSSSITLQQGSQPKQMMMLQNNSAAFGAGVYNSGGGSGLTLRFGAKISHNRATVNGGGIFQNCGAFLTMLPGAQNAFNTPNNLGSGPCV